MNSERTRPTVDKVRCSGCGRCVSACRERITTLEIDGHRKFSLITSPERCSFCRACITACPIDAINMDELPPAD